MARIEYRNWAVTNAGDTIGSAAVEVRRASDTGLATLYVASTGATTKTNPFTADSDGSYTFFVAPDTYSITTGTGPSAESVPWVASDVTELLGTVSESSGVPTGSVIERGSNSNGEYVRFADGTQNCWHNTSGGDITTNGAGTFDSPYFGSTITWTFPAAFTANPEVFVSAVPPSGATNFARRTAGVSRGVVNTTTAFSIIPYRIGADTNNDVFELSLMAVGRWF